MIDWSEPIPDAALDALRTERNSAVAEAALWQRRLLKMQQERDQALADLRACDKSHDEWEEAHAELLQQFRRLEVKYAHLTWAHESSEDMLRHYRHIVGMVAKGEWLIPIDAERVNV